MHDTGKNNYVFLNRDGVWPGFKRSGLELSGDGTLHLSTVPLFSAVPPPDLKTTPAPDGPGGLAIDEMGTLYYSDSASNRVVRVDGCDGSVAPVPCMGGAGSQIAQFQTPRGLLVPKNRNALFVVDSGNDRIQVFDLETFQLVEIWGETGAQPGQLKAPWTLAGDSAGNVYVVDYGNQRVQKFNMFGDVVPGFWNNMHASGLLQQPSDIAVRELNGSRWIFVVDAAAPQILVFNQNGQPVIDSNGNVRSITSNLQAPMGIAAAGDALYVGDNVARRILRFQLEDEFQFIGDAIGYEGPVAALLLDGANNLWVDPGSSLAPLQLQTNTGYAQQGVLWSKKNDPVQVQDRKVVWHRLQALIASLPANARLDLFAFASNNLADAPAVAPDSDNPFADPKWQSIDYAGNLNVTDLYIGGKEAQFLWVGVLFAGDGAATAALHQLRAEFDHLTYDQFLPALYRNTENCGEFLVRLLSLFESLYTETEREIASLAVLFDPKAAPSGFLAWLAGCLGLDVDDNWSEKEERRIIAEIFRLYGRRGTVAGLREMLRLFAGVEAAIEEPLLNASWWSLPSPAESCCDACGASSTPSWQATENSLLGWTTMLAPAQPQGAVVGTSADLDQSHLITDQDFGSPLFTDVAYQFSVQVYRGQVMCPGTLPRLRTVLQQEKPAHTAYHLCIIEPRLRVGFQGRVGIDTVVGGPPRSLELGTDQALGQDTALAGPEASLLGVETRLGLTTRLG